MKIVFKVIKKGPIEVKDKFDVHYNCKTKV